MSYTTYYPTNTCGVQAGIHFCKPCDDTVVKGRVRSIALLDPDVTFTDPSDPAEWLALINASRVDIIPKVQGSYDAGEATTTDGYGNDPTRVTGLRPKLTFNDPTLAENVNFYNSVQFGVKKRIAWVLDDRYLRISRNVVTLIAKDNVENNMDADVVWIVEAELKEPRHPDYYDLPAGVFECFGYTSVCKEVVYAETDLITGIVVSAVTYDFGDSFDKSDTEGIMDALVNTGLAVWSVNYNADDEELTITFTAYNGETWTELTTAGDPVTPTSC